MAPLHPGEHSLEGGRVRQLKNPDGDVIIERLMDFSETERRYSYAVVQAPFPVVDYIATLRVHTVTGREDTAEVQWSGRFVPQGATGEEVVALFTGIYRDGLDALHQALG
ncbi:SRPBCC family protein [Streptomyces chiangmaiensis]